MHTPQLLCLALLLFCAVVLPTSSNPLDWVKPKRPSPPKAQDDVFWKEAKDSFVLVLDEKGLLSAIQTHDMLLCYFYAPFAHYSKESGFDDDLRRVASRVKEMKGKVGVARFDVTEQTDRDILSKKFDIQGFPSIRLFKAGSTKPVWHKGFRGYTAMLHILGVEGDEL
jgi:hypothetical protein